MTVKPHSLSCTDYEKHTALVHFCFASIRSSFLTRFFLLFLLLVDVVVIVVV